MATIDFRALKILVVDDSRDMQFIVKSILHELGVGQTRVASDAAAAFKELHHFPADIIIVDWQMAPLDGLDFVRLVRTAKDSRNPYVPIIMLTGYTEHRRITEARDAGVNEYLAKPVSVQSVSKRLVSLINNPRQFVRTKTYFGPCRRRKHYGPPRGTPERRATGTVSANESHAPS